ncbi:MAG: Nif3-like dinuclear metal center hexameric protein [Gemmatimonadota bacterium]|nr:MAG: Nif3-like dinuclear metal center hexameric protein [Gemmatimonadota bacterium]
MNVDHLVEVMEQIAPAEYAAEWDNVGLLVGAGSWDADRILLAIDLTPTVLREAISHEVDAIVAYHPPIFEPIRRLTDDSPRHSVELAAARHGIALYSPHTALDAAPGGVNDWLAECLGKGDVRALDSHEEQPATEQTKLVTFCPAEAVEPLRNALATVGAGRIGRYHQCSFELRGTGTFFAEASASPAVGETGQLERVDEVRLEMVCPRAALGLAMVMIRQFHPYEEPPIEIHPLLPRPRRDTGHGRRVVLDQKVDLPTLSARLKSRLHVGQLRAAPGEGAPKSYGTIGLCAGAGGALLDAAIDQECELYLTGELRHHDVIDAQARGCTVLLAGHTNTERGYLKVLQKKLTKALDGVAVSVSKKDRDPLKVV